MDSLLTQPQKLGTILSMEPKIIVFVEGGIVTSVGIANTQQPMEVIVVDFDNIEHGDYDPRLDSNYPKKINFVY